ncbi:MAG: sigma-54-dependent Fis family transcriptional regulator [Calditrichaeota bacterium]|nr:sigma-54-dependent Fis family transcriptional regulator [Calditrichota bacterium]RQW02934.1 MAG: sigma-54-dependent Fis family transcriptional regulator [Calditrichota bacterium]
MNKYKKIQDELNIIGQSEKIREVIELVMSVAPTNISVLITGESGVGKEVIAKAIHELSPRRDKQMISVNCGAIPEGLLESELFGHEKGAFTGAIATKKGYFELADGGTIFLDEIGETPIQTQVKLLRVLESGEFMRVGSGELRKVDVRIIAATNRDLSRMVQSKQFRKDLYYRLKAITILVPPLRERKEDIPLLLKHFVEETLKENNVQFQGFTDDAVEVIKNYNWSGNIRELKNFAESIVILAAGKKVDAEMVRHHLHKYSDDQEFSTTLPMPVNTSVERAERELIYKALLSLGVEIRDMKEILLNMNRNIHDQVISEDVEDVSYQDEVQPMGEVEKQMIRKAMAKFNGNKRKAAQALEISERTLYRKLKEYDIE